MQDTLEVTQTTVNPLWSGQGCAMEKVCATYAGQFATRMLGKYVADAAHPRIGIVSAILDVRRYDRDSYYAGVRKVHKGNAIREAKKADRAGLVSKLFAWSNHIPDIHEINTSKAVRSGGEMRAAYHRSIEEMGGAPKALAAPAAVKCPLHHTYCWGIFEPRPGHRQGDIVTDEKLLGYIKFKRNGNYAAYSSFLGHGDYLNLGIMYRLHYAIMDWIFHERAGLSKGLDFILYGAIDSGGEGLQLWKKRMLFEGARLALDPGARLPSA